MPLQHLTGSAAFRHLELAVGPGVFVPRPETELLVDAVLAALRSPARGPTPVVVDLCAGSGAIALSVAARAPARGRPRRRVAQRPRSRGFSATRPARSRPAGCGCITPIVADAPDRPGRNRRRRRVATRRTSRSTNATCVDPEVREHDPAEALWAGADGLTVIRRVVAAAAALLRPGGVLVVEHADVQGGQCPTCSTAGGLQSTSPTTPTSPGATAVHGGGTRGMERP